MDILREFNGFNISFVNALTVEPIRTSVIKLVNSKDAKNESKEIPRIAAELSITTTLSLRESIVNLERFINAYRKITIKMSNLPQ